MNTPEYKIIKTESLETLEFLVNQAINGKGKEVTVLGGVMIEIYPNYSPRYYQAILIKEVINQQILVERSDIIPFRPINDVGEDIKLVDDFYGKTKLLDNIDDAVSTLKKERKKQLKKEVPKVIHESNQRLPNSWDL